MVGASKVQEFHNLSLRGGEGGGEGGGGILVYGLSEEMYEM